VGDAFPEALSDITFDGLDVDRLIQVGCRFHGARRGGHPLGTGAP
jgi:hypothetical protein